jgi:hypothetical protein
MPQSSPLFRKLHYKLPLHIMGLFLTIQYLIPTSVNLFPQQLIVVIANIPPTIDAPTFVDPVGEFFRVLELEFSVKSFEKKLQLTTFSQQRDETLKMFYMRFIKLKEDIQNITNLEATHRYLRSLEGILTFHA